MKSPTGWVDPVTAEDWAAWAAFGVQLRRRDAQREAEIARALARATRPSVPRRALESLVAQGSAPAPLGTQPPIGGATASR